MAVLKGQEELDQYKLTRREGQWTHLRPPLKEPSKASIHNPMAHLEALLKC